MKRRIIIACEALFAAVLIGTFYWYNRLPQSDAPIIVSMNASAQASAVIAPPDPAELTVVDQTNPAPEDAQQYAPDIVLRLDSRTKTTGCSPLAGLPDHACTPGAALDMTVEALCHLSSTKSIRNVTDKTRKAVYAEYGVKYPQPTGAYEVDHLIPLELAGSNDISNLFLEAADPAPGFHEKDLVENYLHDQVCGGQMGLAQAQMQIANNWLAVYESLTPEQIAALKQEIFSKYGGN